jgi:hypothetical protein
MEKGAPGLANGVPEPLPLPAHSSYAARSPANVGRKVWVVGMRLLLFYTCILAFQESRAILTDAGTRNLFAAAGLLSTTSNASTVHWKSCGDGIERVQCANISVPLDHRNLSDPRTVTIAVTRLPASDKKNRSVLSHETRDTLATTKVFSGRALSLSTPEDLVYLLSLRLTSVSSFALQGAPVHRKSIAGAR